MTTKNTSIWVYLDDLVGHTNVARLDGTDVRTIYPANVAGEGPIGLRYFLLESDDDGHTFHETGERLAPEHPAFEDIFELSVDYSRKENSWIFDAPHWKIDAETPDSVLATLRETLAAKMARHPFDFEIIGLAPRALMYFSDGTYDSQKRFLAMVPEPTGTPFRRDGQLKPRYRGNWSSESRDRGEPFPTKYSKQVGNLRPLLYCGPAAVVRFKLDNQLPAFEHCRIYVTLEGDFIASDWCQRHDYSSYRDGGINLQMGIYDFDTWIVNSCVPRAMSQGVFKPRKVELKTHDVRDLLKRAGGSIGVPTLEEAKAKAAKLVAQQTTTAGPATMPDPLIPLVKECYTPDVPVPTQAAAIVAELAAAFEASGDSAKGIGLSVQVPSAYIVSSMRDKVERVAKDRSRILLFSSCGEKKACCLTTKSPEGHTNHTHHAYDAQVIVVDRPHTLARVIALLDDEARRRAPAVVGDPGPITAEVLQMALDMARARQDAELEAERQLLQAEVEERGRRLATLTAPKVEYDIGGFRFTYREVEGRTLCTIGPDTRVVGMVGDTVVSSLPTSNPTAETPLTAKVDPGSALDRAVRWYFTVHLPSQLKEQAAAEGSAVGFKLGLTEYRGYQIPGGDVVLVRYESGQPAARVLARRKSNGHSYQVDPATGETSLLDADWKPAVQFYFGYIHVPTAA